LPSNLINLPAVYRTDMLVLTYTSTKEDT
jgi:hypothetical protein